MPRIDFKTGNFIGDGENATFEILRRFTNLKELDHKEFPNVGIYRQLPVSLVYDKDQWQDLADFHKKSSIDIFIVPYYDEYTPSLSRIAVRVEGKKGDLKMARQAVQKRMLTKHCRVVDVHKRNCPMLFHDIVNTKSIKELAASFEESRVDFPGNVI